MRRNKGITLIALIITIIILLILVGVSLNLVIKGDLFGSAEKAVTGTNAKVNEEQSRVDELMGELDRINERQTEHNWKRTGDNLTCNHCNRTVTIGQELDYTDNGKVTSSISAEKAGGYTGGTAKGGQPTETQTINKDSNTRWVVLGAEDSNKNGTNETLLITTKTPTEGAITLYGAASYNNCIGEINRMCKELYGTNARGMTIEDVNNCLNYIPVGGMYYLNSTYNTIGDFTTKLKELGEMWTAIKNYNTNLGVFYDPSNPEGIKDNGATLGEYELNGYYYHLSADGTYLVDVANPEDTSNTITTATRDLIFGTDADYYYWLASRGVGADSNVAYFGPGAVDGRTARSCIGLFHSVGISNTYGLSLRAVVSLRADIPAVVE